MALQRGGEMSSRFRAGASVAYAGRRRRVRQVLDTEAVLLGLDSGQEVAADPLRSRLLDSLTLGATSPEPVDELRYDEALGRIARGA